MFWSLQLLALISSDKHLFFNSADFFFIPFAVHSSWIIQTASLYIRAIIFVSIIVIFVFCIIQCVKELLTYLLAYLLTYSMEQGPSWEAS